MRNRNLAVVVTLLAAGGTLRLCPWPTANAAEKPAGTKKAVAKTAAKAGAKSAPAKPALKPLPRFVSAQTIETLRALRGGGPPPVLQPLANGEPLPDAVPGLPGADPNAADA